MFLLRVRKRLLVTVVASLSMLGTLSVSAESSSITLDEHLKTFELREDRATKLEDFSIRHSLIAGSKSGLNQI